MTADTITFAELLTRLGYGAHDGAKHENVSVCHQPVGGSFNSDVTGWENAPGLVRSILERYEFMGHKGRPHRSRVGFPPTGRTLDIGEQKRHHSRRSSRRHGIASAHFMCPSKPRDFAMAR